MHSPKQTENVSVTTIPALTLALPTFSLAKKNNSLPFRRRCNQLWLPSINHYDLNRRKLTCPFTSKLTADKNFSFFKS